MCFLGLGQRSAETCGAALFSQTYENTADYKRRTHSERSLGWYEKADAPKHKKSELQSLFFPLELLCPCGAVRAREKVCRASALRFQSPTSGDTATSPCSEPPPREVGVYLTKTVQSVQTQRERERERERV